MIKALGTTFAVGGVLGLLVARHLRLRSEYGPKGALGGELAGGVADVPRALMQSTGSEFEGGNKLLLLHNGEIFDGIEQAVREAKHSVHVDVFIWKPGNPGERLAELMAKRAREGVAIRVLVDPMGSTDFHEVLCPELRAAGCEVNYFRPLKKRPLTLTGRNHRKIIIVDGRVGFTGGFGIAPEWTGDGLEPAHWRDVNVRIEGPTVRQLQMAFASHWLESGGSLIPQEEFDRAKPAGKARATFVTSMDVVGLSSARWVTHIALAAARKRVWVANAYFAPPPELVGSLCERSRAGVDVRLMLPGPYQDHPTVSFLQRRLYTRMGDCGIKLYEYQPSMMHAKTMLVDDSIVIVGSINLDILSQELLEEGALVVADEAFAAEIEKSWHKDISRTKQQFSSLPAGLRRLESKLGPETPVLPVR